VRLKEGITPTGSTTAPTIKSSKSSDISADLAALDLDSANI